MKIKEKLVLLWHVNFAGNLFNIFPACFVFTKAGNSCAELDSYNRVILLARNFFY
jgi:hypothetical protein